MKYITFIAGFQTKMIVGFGKQDVLLSLYSVISKIIQCFKIHSLVRLLWNVLTLVKQCNHERYTIVQETNYSQIYLLRTNKNSQ